MASLPGPSFFGKPIAAVPQELPALGTEMADSLTWRERALSIPEVGEIPPMSISLAAGLPAELLLVEQQRYCRREEITHGSTPLLPLISVLFWGVLGGVVAFWETFRQKMG